MRGEARQTPYQAATARNRAPLNISKNVRAAGLKY